MILGTAVVPHLLLRISTSLTGRSARRSMSIAAGLNGAFFLLLTTTGFAAAAVVGSKNIEAVDANGQSSPILLAAGLLSDNSAAKVTLITIMACVAFLAALTTVTSVTFAAAVSIAHDVFARGKRRHTDIGEVRALRLAVVLLCMGGPIARRCDPSVPNRIPGRLLAGRRRIMRLPRTDLLLLLVRIPSPRAPVVRIRGTSDLRRPHLFLPRRLRNRIRTLAGSGFLLVSPEQSGRDLRTGRIPPRVVRQHHLAKK
ncbi:hypothetical protein ACIGHB_03230 [Streptomyces sp. NPDC085460]|uniref:sodium:solute symporter family transporter n=1 Tax=Streptomyces sp. NPDC085460 TaxID=3365723 RepID=UPI0037CD2D70